MKRILMSLPCVKHANIETTKGYTIKHLPVHLHELKISVEEHALKHPLLCNSKEEANQFHCGYRVCINELKN
jgi:hypothetical protein